jgi:putative Mg2+ transporter-C (MgtC) family protein
MGFIGGGAILKTENSVRGTATAASLWATGATGAAVGLGAYDVAVVISLFTFLTLWLLVPFKQEGASGEAK